MQFIQGRKKPPKPPPQTKPRVRTHLLSKTDASKGENDGIK